VIALTAVSQSCGIIVGGGSLSASVFSDSLL